MRIVTLVLSLLLLAAALPAARAGDAAELEILGFDRDGGVFAFEEYGVQDGSGFPYSNRFYIDTETDRFLPGTPIRVRLDDEAATVEQARAESRRRGEEVVKQSVLSANPGFTAGYNAVTELSADAYRMAVNPRPVFPPIDETLEIRLEQFPVHGVTDCEAIGGTSGFRLLRIDARDGGRTTLLHEDESVPRSRGCPTDYRIGAVQTFFPESGSPVFVVLISVIGYGFEGPDHRWIGVPGHF